MPGVTLINPAINFDENLGLARRFAVRAPPLGIAYLASILGGEGERVSIVDQFAEDLPDTAVLDRIERFGADIVGISLLTASATRTRRLCTELRRRSPGTRIVVGNIHASVFGDRILREGWADVVVHGEGEPIIAPLVRALRGAASLDTVPSVSFIEDGTVRSTSRTAQIRDVDRIPMPAWHLFPLSVYQSRAVGGFGQRVLPLISSRGCPWVCSFCSQNLFWAKTIVRDPALVVDEMRVGLEQYGVRFFAFYDANFPVSRGYGLKLCRELQRSGLPARGVRFLTEARVEIFDDELIEAMGEAGCRVLMFGIESGSDRVRATIDKAAPVPNIEHVVRTCRKHGIYTMGLFLLGLPSERREDALETVSLARRLDLDVAKFNVVVPYPGSPLFEQFVDPSSIREEDFDRIATFYSDSPRALTVNEHMSALELQRLQKYALRRFYLRPKTIVRLILGDLLSLGDLAVGALAMTKSALAQVRGASRALLARSTATRESSASATV